MTTPKTAYVLMYYVEYEGYHFSDKHSQVYFDESAAQRKKAELMEEQWAWCEWDVVELPVADSKS